MEKLTKEEYRAAQNKSTRKLMAKKRSNKKALLSDESKVFIQKQTIVYRDKDGKKFSISAPKITRKENGQHQKHVFPGWYARIKVAPYERNISWTAYIPGVYEPSIAYEDQLSENNETRIIPAVLRNEARMPANANFSYVRGERVIWDL